MSTHTPGPWTVGEMCAGEIAIKGPTRVLVATADAKFQTRAGEAEANARLIAAAPEILVALKTAVQLYETYGLVAGDADCGTWVNTSRDAIRKADGR